MLNLREDNLSINLNNEKMSNFKSKLEVRHEAARLALASEAKDFRTKATEIYEFITEGIDLPDTYDEQEAQRALLSAVTRNMPSTFQTADQTQVN